MGAQSIAHFPVRHIQPGQPKSVLRVRQQGSRLANRRIRLVHVALSTIAILLVAVVALRLGVPWKARSIATFGWRETLVKGCNIASVWRAQSLLLILITISIDASVNFFFGVR